MNIKEILHQYLSDNKYDGLFLNDECACRLEEFMPCNAPNTNCTAGYILKGRNHKDNEYDFSIGLDK